MNKKDNLLFVFDVYNSLTTYFPVLIFPICIYHELGSMLLSGIAVAIWRIMTYYKFTIIRHLFEKRYYKMFIVIIIVVALVSNNNFSICFLMLTSSVMSEYFSYENTKLLLQKYKMAICIIGMVIAGILLNNTFALVLFLSNDIIFMLFTGTLSEYDERRCNVLRGSVSHKLCVAVFVQNFHYYCYVFIIPIVIIKNFQSEILVGIVFAINWMLYGLKTSIRNLLYSKISKDNLVIVGYIITACLMLSIGLVNNNIVQTILFVLQGSVAGITELVFQYSEINENNHLYWNCWKIGGILGAFLGGIVAIVWGINCTFIVSAITVLSGGGILALKKYDDKKVK